MSNVHKKIGVVALLDALGTKGVWKRENPEAVVKTWDNLMNTYHDVSQKRTEKEYGYKSNFFAFSDTIIITATGNDITKTLISLGVDLGIIFTHSILNKFFIRGCISVGEFFHGQRIVIGPAIDEASQYYMMPNWVGISTSPSAYRILYKQSPKQLLEFGYGHVFIPHEIPTKLGLEKSFAINLPWAYKTTANSFKKELRLDGPDTLNEIFESELDRTNEIDVSFKIRNTLEFIKYADKINDEFQRENP